MKKVIVTAGAKGADIDVLACVVAYAELLTLENKLSIPVIPGQFTMSVTGSILAWGAVYKTEYISNGDEDFVLVDISDPIHFPKFVDLLRVTEVYDHRQGHEEYWKKVNKHQHIEMVGACGTLIWEEFIKRGNEDKISVCSARLLLASIVSNTLNFKSPLTTERDKLAYSQLSKSSNLSEDWIAKYFEEQEVVLYKDFSKYIEADTKTVALPSCDFVIAQVELWNASNFLAIKSEELNLIMAKYEKIPWIVNIISISENFNYIYSKSQTGRELVEKALGIKFYDNVAITRELTMRKHLTKILREKYI